MNFRTNYNFVLSPKDLERTEGVSQTISGEVKTVREILIAFTNGAPLPGAKNIVYDENPTFDDLVIKSATSSFDLVDTDTAMASVAIVTGKQIGRAHV